MGPDVWVKMGTVDMPPALVELAIVIIVAP